MKINLVTTKDTLQYCPIEEVEAPVKSEELYPEEGGEPYVWKEISTKPMAEILLDRECWFDRYGNLCSKEGHLSPAHFKDLGKIFHVIDGCGFSSEETKWLRYY